MNEFWAANAAVAVATLGTVSLAVLIHYEGLIFVSQRLRLLKGPQRIRVMYAILCVIALHVAEIWVFGTMLWLLIQWPACGHIALAPHLTAPFGFFDAIYLSAATFTTLDFGDLAPVGPVRFLASTEALTGLVLIAWSASFTYLKMERFWREP